MKPLLAIALLFGSAYAVKAETPTDTLGQMEWFAERANLELPPQIPETVYDLSGCVEDSVIYTSLLGCYDPQTNTVYVSKTNVLIEAVQLGYAFDVYLASVLFHERGHAVCEVNGDKCASPANSKPMFRHHITLMFWESMYRANLIEDAKGK